MDVNNTLNVLRVDGWWLDVHKMLQIEEISKCHVASSSLTERLTFQSTNPKYKRNTTGPSRVSRSSPHPNLVYVNSSKK